MKHCRSVWRRRLVWAAAAFGFMLGVPFVGRAADRDFPFDQELLLDARPMRGSKRIPGLEIGPDGKTVIDLWCDRVEGQFVVVEDTITILAGPRIARTCSAEQARGDAELLAALSQVTNWRREGETLVLLGPKTLRFRVPTN